MTGFEIAILVVIGLIIFIGLLVFFCQRYIAYKKASIMIKIEIERNHGRTRKHWQKELRRLRRYYLFGF